MEGIKALLFDIDGTVLDTTEFIIQATEHALKEHGFPSDRAKIISAIGKPFPLYYYELSGMEDQEQADKLVIKHREFQHANYHLAKIFQNAKATLEKLKAKGYKIAAVTTRSSHTSHQTLKDAGIHHIFDCVISWEDVTAHKPDPEPLLKALEIVGERPESAVMVGDTYIDIEAGKNAGTKTVRATYGFHQERMHEPEPDYFIDDISELLKIL